MKHLQQTEPFFEVMALNAIVEDIMKNDSEKCVTYLNDGSSMSNVGSYCVQSLTLNEIQRSLPTMGVFSESNKTVKEQETGNCPRSQILRTRYTLQNFTCYDWHYLS